MAKQSLKVTTSTIALFLAFQLGQGAARSLTSGSPVTLHGNCHRPCSVSENEEFAYQRDTTYIYEYSVTSVTSMKGVSEQESKALITCQAAVEVVDACNFRLKVFNVQSEGQRADHLADILEERPLSFSFHNGKVMGVSVDKDEHEWALNFKRGLLSAFQNQIADNLLKVEETDVIGTCTTSYVKKGTTKNLVDVYSKVKDMKSCRHNQRLHHQNALNLPEMNVQQFPLLESTHECEFQVNDDGVLIKSDCLEVHSFQPFHAGANGAVTEQKQSLQLVQIKNGVRSIECMDESDVPIKVTDLLYEQPEDPKETGNLEWVSKQIRYLRIIPESQKPRQFTAIVSEMRKLKFHELFDLIVRLEDDLEVILDAIPLLKTEAGVRLMVEILTNNDIELSNRRKDQWYSALSSYKKPTRMMVGALSTLLQKENLRSSAMLGISILTSTFCSEHENCDDMIEVRDIITSYENILGNECETTTAGNKEKVILSLKALRNIGRLQSSSSVLDKCFTKSSNDVEVRLAAMDTASLINCQGYFYSHSLTNVLKDISEDSEVRIAAYLALITCPTHAQISDIKNLLKYEEVNQVGSFIWTHLSNIQESTSKSPNIIYLKSFLGDETLQKKWQTDATKFSRYFETSYFHDSLKVGGTAEGSIIFSTKSFLPRSAKMNFTANVFGESLNLFEFGLRGEDLEETLESIVGPDGVLREDGLHKVLQGLKNQQSTRNGVSKQPCATLYARSFGKDMYYQRFDGLPSYLAQFMKSPYSILSHPDSQYEFSKSSIFLDGNLVVPTASGFPLSLSVNGSYNVDFKSSFKWDLKEFFSSGDARMQASVSPTATVEVVGLMSVDMVGSQTGLKTVHRLHTSTVFDGSLRIAKDKLLTVDLNMPKDTIEMVDASIEFFILEDGDLKELQSDLDVDEVNYCTPELANDLIALRGCTSLKYHSGYLNEGSPMLFFAGSSHIRMNLAKTDTFSHYRFEMAKNNDCGEDPVESCVKILFNTIGTPRKTHETSMTLSYGSEDGVSFSTDIRFPVNELRVSSRCEWKATSKFFKAVALSGTNNLAEIKFAYIHDGKQGIYEWISALSFQDVELFNFSASSIIKKRKGQFSAELGGVMWKKPMQLKGHYYSGEDGSWMRTSFSSKWLSYEMSNHLAMRSNSIKLNSDISYRYLNNERNMSLQARYQAIHEEDMNDVFLELTIQSFNEVILDASISKTNSNEVNSIAVKYHGFNRHYELSQIYAYDPKGSFKWSSSIKDLISAKNYTVELSYEMSKSRAHILGHLEFGHDFLIHSHLLYVNTNDQKEFSGELSYPGNAYKLRLALETQKEQKNAEAVLQWGLSEQEVIRAQILLKESNSALVDKKISAVLHIMDWSAIEATGVISMNSPRLFASLEVESDGYVLYVIKAEHGPVGDGSEEGIHISISDYATTYNLTLIYRFDEDVQAVKADANLHKNYSLMLIGKNNFRDVDISLSFNETTGKSRKIGLNYRLEPESVFVNFDYFGHVTVIDAVLRADNAHVKVKNGPDFIGVAANWKVSKHDLGLKCSFNSSWSALKNVLFMARHSIKSHNNGFQKLSQVVFEGNNKESFALALFQETTDTGEEWKLSSSSTNPTWDAGVIRFAFVRGEQSQVEAHTQVNYQGVILATASVVFDFPNKIHLDFKSPMRFAKKFELKLEGLDDDKILEFNLNHRNHGKLNFSKSSISFDLSWRSFLPETFNTKVEIGLNSQKFVKAAMLYKGFIFDLDFNQNPYITIDIASTCLLGNQYLQTVNVTMKPEELSIVKNDILIGKVSHYASESPRKLSIMTNLTTLKQIDIIYGQFDHSYSIQYAENEVIKANATFVAVAKAPKGDSSCSPMPVQSVNAVFFTDVSNPLFVANVHLSQNECNLVRVDASIIIEKKITTIRLSNYANESGSTIIKTTMKSDFEPFLNHELELNITNDKRILFSAQKMPWSNLDLDKIPFEGNFHGVSMKLAHHSKQLNALLALERAENQHLLVTNLWGNLVSQWSNWMLEHKFKNFPDEKETWFNIRSMDHPEEVQLDAGYSYSFEIEDNKEMSKRVISASSPYFQNLPACEGNVHAEMKMANSRSNIHSEIEILLRLSNESFPLRVIASHVEKPVETETIEADVNVLMTSTFMENNEKILNATLKAIFSQKLLSRADVHVELDSCWKYLQNIHSSFSFKREEDNVNVAISILNDDYHASLEGGVKMNKSNFEVLGQLQCPGMNADLTILANETNGKCSLALEDVVYEGRADYRLFSREKNIGVSLSRKEKLNSSWEEELHISGKADFVMQSEQTKFHLTLASSSSNSSADLTYEDRNEGFSFKYTDNSMFSSSGELQVDLAMPWNASVGIIRISHQRPQWIFALWWNEDTHEFKFNSEKMELLLKSNSYEPFLCFYAPSSLLFQSSYEGRTVLNIQRNITSTENLRQDILTFESDLVERFSRVFTLSVDKRPSDTFFSTLSVNLDRILKGDLHLSSDSFNLTVYSEESAILPQASLAMEGLLSRDTKSADVNIMFRNTTLFDLALKKTNEIFIAYTHSNTMQFESSLIRDKFELDANFSYRSNPIFSLHFDSFDHEILFELLLNNFLFFKHSLRINFAYSFDNHTRQLISLKGSFDEYELSVNTSLSPTPDSLVSFSKISTNICFLEDISAMSLNYSISVKPEFSLSIQKGPDEHRVKGVMTFDSDPIPTLALYTTFKNFESIIISGQVRKANKTYLIKVALTVNEEVLSQVLGEVQLADQRFSSKLRLQSKLLPALNGELSLDVQWIDVYEIVSKLKYKDDLFKLKGSVSQKWEDVQIQISSPIEGFRSVYISGHSVNREGRKMFGARYNDGNSSHELGLDYTIENGHDSLSVKLPLQSLREVALKTRRKRESKVSELSFDFETQGLAENTAQFGFGYTIDSEIGDISARGILSCPSSEKDRWELSGNLYAKWKNIGETSSEPVLKIAMTTPIKEIESISLILATEDSVLEEMFEIGPLPSKFSLILSSKSVAKPPTLNVTSRFDPDSFIFVIRLREEELALIDFTMKENRVSYESQLIFKINWFHGFVFLDSYLLTKSSLDDNGETLVKTGHGYHELQSSFQRLHFLRYTVHGNTRKEGSQEVLTVNESFLLNSMFFNGTSAVTVLPENTTYKYHGETNMNVGFSTIDAGIQTEFGTELPMDFKTIANISGTISLDEGEKMDVALSIKTKDGGASVFTAQGSITNFVSDLQALLEFYNVDDNKVLSLEVTGNVANSPFELEGVVEKLVESSGIKANFNFERGDKSYALVSSVEQSPEPKFLLLLKSSDGFQQKLEVVVAVDSESMPKLNAQVKANTAGTLGNMIIITDMILSYSEMEALLKLDAKGKLMSLEFNDEIAINLNLTKQLLINHLNRRGTEQNSKLHLLWSVFDIRAVDVKLVAFSPLFSNCAAEVKWNIKGRPMSLYLKLLYDKLDWNYELKGRGIWSLRESEFMFQCSGPGIPSNVIVLKGKREGVFEKMKYELSSGRRVVMLIGLNKIQGPLSFSLNYRLHSQNIDVINDIVLKMRAMRDDAAIKVISFVKMNNYEMSSSLSVESLKHWESKLDIRDTSLQDYAGPELSLLVQTAEENDQERVLTSNLKIISRHLNQPYALTLTTDFDRDVVMTKGFVLNVDSKSKIVEGELKFDPQSQSLFASVSTFNSKLFEGTLNWELLAEGVKGEMVVIWKDIDSRSVQFLYYHMKELEVKYLVKEEIHSLARMSFTLSEDSKSKIYEMLIKNPVLVEPLHLTFTRSNQVKELRHSINIEGYFKEHRRITASLILAKDKIEFSIAPANIFGIKDIGLLAEINVNDPMFVHAYVSKIDASKIFDLRTDVSLHGQTLETKVVLYSDEVFYLKTSLMDRGININVRSKYELMNEAVLEGSWEQLAPGETKIMAQGTVNGQNVVFIGELGLKGERTTLSWNLEFADNRISQIIEASISKDLEVNIKEVLNINDEKYSLEVSSRIRGLVLEFKTQFTTTDIKIPGFELIIEATVSESSEVHLQILLKKVMNELSEKLGEIEFKWNIQSLRRIEITLNADLPVIESPYSKYTIELLFNIEKASDFGLGLTFSIYPLTFEFAYGIQFKLDQGKLHAELKGNYGQNMVTEFIAISIDADFQKIEENTISADGSIIIFGREYKVFTEVISCEGVLCKAKLGGSRTASDHAPSEYFIEASKESEGLNYAITIHWDKIIDGDLQLGVNEDNVNLRGSLKSYPSKSYSSVIRLDGTFGESGKLEISFAKADQTIRVKRDVSGLSFDLREGDESILEMEIKDSEEATYEGYFILNTDSGFSRLKYSANSWRDFQMEVLSPLLPRNGFKITFFIDLFNNPDIQLDISSMDVSHVSFLLKYHNNQKIHISCKMNLPKYSVIPALNVDSKILISSKHFVLKLKTWQDLIIYVKFLPRKTCEVQLQYGCLNFRVNAEKQSWNSFLLNGEAQFGRANTSMRGFVEVDQFRGDMKAKLAFDLDPIDESPFALQKAFWEVEVKEYLVRRLQYDWYLLNDLSTNIAVGVDHNRHRQILLVSQGSLHHGQASLAVSEQGISQLELSIHTDHPQTGTFVFKNPSWLGNVKGELNMWRDLKMEWSGMHDSRSICSFELSLNSKYPSNSLYSRLFLPAYPEEIFEVEVDLKEEYENTLITIHFRNRLGEIIDGEWTISKSDPFILANMIVVHSDVQGPLRYLLEEGMYSCKLGYALTGRNILAAHLSWPNNSLGIALEGYYASSGIDQGLDIQIDLPFQWLKLQRLAAFCSKKFGKYGFALVHKDLPKFVALWNKHDGVIEALVERLLELNIHFKKDMSLTYGTSKLLSSEFIFSFHHDYYSYEYGQYLIKQYGRDQSKIYLYYRKNEVAISTTTSKFGKTGGWFSSDFIKFIWRNNEVFLVEKSVINPGFSVSYKIQANAKRPLTLVLEENHFLPVGLISNDDFKESSVLFLLKCPSKSHCYIVLSDWLIGVQKSESLSGSPLSHIFSHKQQQWTLNFGRKKLDQIHIRTTAICSPRCINQFGFTTTFLHDDNIQIKLHRGEDEIHFGLIQNKGKSKQRIELSWKGELVRSKENLDQFHNLMVKVRKENEVGIEIVEGSKVEISFPFYSYSSVYQLLQSNGFTVTGQFKSLNPLSQDRLTLEMNAVWKPTLLHFNSSLDIDDIRIVTANGHWNETFAEFLLISENQEKNLGLTIGEMSSYDYRVKGFYNFTAMDNSWSRISDFCHNSFARALKQIDRVMIFEGIVTKPLSRFSSHLSGIPEELTFLSSLHASHFPLIDSLESFVKVFDDIWVHILIFRDRMILNTTKTLSTFAVESYELMETYAQEISPNFESMRGAYKCISTHLTFTLEDLIDGVEGGLDYLNNIWLSSKSILKLGLSSASKIFSNTLDWITSTFAQIWKNDYISCFCKSIASFLERLEWEKFKNLLEDAISSVLSPLELWWCKVKEIIAFKLQEMFDVFESNKNSFGYLIGKVLKFVKLLFANNDDMQSVIGDFVEKSDAILSLMMRALRKGFEPSSWFSYSFSHNKDLDTFEYNQTLPVSRDSYVKLKKLSMLFFSVDGDDLVSTSKEHLTFLQYQHHFMDTLDVLANPSLLEGKLFQPFFAHGVITSESKGVTYDGKLISLASSKYCNILLTSRGGANPFSVRASYYEDTWREIFISLNNMTIVLGHDLSVIVNQDRIALPMDLGPLQITRDGHFVQAASPVIKVRYDGSMVSVSVRGWESFGKMFGLFGNYNYEPHDDHPHHESDILTCEGKNVYNEVSAANYELHPCFELFTDPRSSLMPCFATVPVRSYIKMCAFDLLNNPRNEVERSRAKCNSAAAYVEVCRLRGLEMYMPMECSSCNIEQKGLSLIGGESTEVVTSAEDSFADVVYIVDNVNALHQLSSLHEELWSHRQNTMKDHFAVVGFGQNFGGNPHAITSPTTGKVFNPKVETQNTLAWWFQANRLGESPRRNINYDDFLSAILFATNLDLRPGSHRFFVISVSENVTDEDSGAGLAAYHADIMFFLREYNIHLQYIHPLLREHPFICSMHARGQLKPKDLLSTLALESGGCILSRDLMTKPDEEKKPLNALKTTLNNALHEEQCQRCDCVASNTYRGRMRCHACNMPFAVVDNLWNVTENVHV